MKKSILAGAVIALVLSGCSGSGEPQVDETKKAEAPQEVESVKSEAVSAEDSNVQGMESETLQSTSDSNEVSIDSLENELETVYFAFDKFNIDTEAQNSISKNASTTKNEASDYTIKLEGNCDEWGSDEYNFALGLKRADAVKKALVAEGVDASRITMVSYGESNPVCNDKTKECWSKNRRVDHKLLP